MKVGDGDSETVEGVKNTTLCLSPKGNTKGFGFTMPHRTRPMTALLLFTSLNAVLCATITPVYDFVCFLPYWERRVGTSHASCVKLMPDTLVEYGDAVLVSHPMINGRFLSKGHTFYRTGDAFLQFTDGEKPEYELELLDTESVPAEKKSRSAKSQSELFKAVVNVSGLSVDSALNKWVARGK
ncbi:hypothetical protein RYX36_033251 [Vicia faba]